MGGLEPRHAANAPTLELGAHRGVERHVTAGHVVTELLQKAGQGSHAGAGNGDDVDSHERIKPQYYAMNLGIFGSGGLALDKSSCYEYRPGPRRNAPFS